MKKNNIIFRQVKVYEGEDQLIGLKEGDLMDMDGNFFICDDKLREIFPNRRHFLKLNEEGFVCFSETKPKGIHPNHCSKILIRRNVGDMGDWFSLFLDKDTFITSLFTPRINKIFRCMFETIFDNYIEGYVYLTKTHPITKKRIRK